MLGYPTTYSSYLSYFLHHLIYLILIIILFGCYLVDCKDMCLKVHEYCSAYLTYLSPEQLAFINCNQTLEDGSPLFSTDSGISSNSFSFFFSLLSSLLMCCFFFLLEIIDCYTLENLVPVVRCTNESFPSGKDLFFSFFFSLFFFS